LDVKSDHSVQSWDS
jgi:hypothetical protein